MSKPEPLRKFVSLNATVEKADDEATLEANIEKLKTQINAEVRENKTRLIDWLKRNDPEDTSPVSIALLEIAFERALDTHDADAGEYIDLVFQHVAQQRKNRLQ